MSVDQLLHVVSQGLDMTAVTATRAVRRFERTTVDTAVLFGVATLLVAHSWSTAASGSLPTGFWRP